MEKYHSDFQDEGENQMIYADIFFFAINRHRKRIEHDEANLYVKSGNCDGVKINVDNEFAV